MLGLPVATRISDIPSLLKPLMGELHADIPHRNDEVIRVIHFTNRMLCAAGVFEADHASRYGDDFPAVDEPECAPPINDP
jgi:hypothetical protein